MLPDFGKQLYSNMLPQAQHKKWIQLLMQQSQYTSLAGNRNETRQLVQRSVIVINPAIMFVDHWRWFEEVLYKSLRLELLH